MIHRALMIICYFAFSSIALAGEPKFKVDELKSPVEIGFRGLSVVDLKVVWASGQKGTVLRTVDGGATWEVSRIPDCDAIDFRDIHAFDANRAIVMSAGTPAVSFETADGGKTWSRCFYDENPALFFDAIEFTKDQSGFAFSDPITATDGSLRFPFLTRSKSDADWKYLPEKSWPVAQKGEAAFAASGSSLTIVKNTMWMGLGGEVSNGKARVLTSRLDREGWSTSETPLVSNKSSGVFAISFVDESTGIIVGGDYEKPNDASNVVALTSDGGKSWRKPAGKSPSGFRSAVDFTQSNGRRVWLTVGTNGVDYSIDDGENWNRVSNSSLNAIQFAVDENIAFGVGPKGKIVRFTLSE